MQATGIHHLFEHQVVRTPDAIAVLCGDVAVSYRELNRRAGALACALRHRGIGPDTLVGLLAERSPEMVAGVLAVPQAGGAYLPLNRDDPGARRRILVA